MRLAPIFCLLWKILIPKIKVNLAKQTDIRYFSQATKGNEQKWTLRFQRHPCKPDIGKLILGCVTESRGPFSNFLAVACRLFLILNYYVHFNFLLFLSVFMTVGQWISHLSHLFRRGPGWVAVLQSTKFYQRMPSDSIVNNEYSS